METNKEYLICWNDLTEKQKAGFFIKLQKELRKDENATNKGTKSTLD